jgi:hypothetical protein
MTESSLRAGLACGAATVLAVAVYLNALHNPFVYDDYHTVVDNSSIQRLGDLRAIVWHDVTRPIVNFSYAVDRAVWGRPPFGFHLTNMLLHALNVWLLFRLARRLADAANADVAAFASAALFAVHPMMTEAVGYISGRSEVLCAAFFLLAFACGRRWLRSGGAGWGAVTIALWLAALAAKETAAAFPFVLFAYDAVVNRDDATATRRRLWSIHLPLMAAASLAGLARVVILARVEYPGQVAVHWRYLLLDLDVLRRYATMLIVPSGQAIFHEEPAISGVFESRAIIAIGSVGVILALVWWVRRAAPIVSFGLLWFLLALAPSSVLILLDRGEPMTEHRVYLASCGVFLAAGAAIGRLWAAAEHEWRPGRALFGVALGLVLASFAVETVLRNAIWADPVALWRESVDRAPNHYRPRLLLGEALQDSGRRVEALEQFRTAVRLRPADSMAYVETGLCLFRMGRPRDARPYFLEALARDPRNEAARRALVLVDTLGPMK